MATEKDKVITNSSGSDNRKMIIIGFGLVIVTIIVAAIVICIAIMNKGDNESETLGNGIHPMSETSSGEEKLQSGMFRINMNNDWMFSKGDQPSENAIFRNDYVNNNTVFYTLTDNKTGELIYTSDKIPVGYEETGVKLDKPLEAGTYETTCKINLIDNDGKVVDGLSLALTLIILE